MSASRYAERTVRFGADGLACDTCFARHVCQPESVGDERGLGGKIIKRHRAIKRGRLVYRAGDPCHSLCAVCKGSVKTHVLKRNGSAQVTGFHIAGELVGAPALATKQYLCSATALEPTIVCEILVSRLQELAGRDPSFRQHLFDLLTRELAFDHCLLVSLVGKGNARQSLSAFIHHLSRRYGRHGFSPLEFPMRMSRHDIGSYLGLAKETVSRLLTSFEQQGLIAAQKRNMVIRERGRLEEIADLPEEDIDLEW